MVFGLHEYRPIYRFEASSVKPMRLILPREFSFQLLLGFCTLSHSQHWKYNRPIRCSRFFTVTYHGVEVDILKDESLEYCLLHVCHLGIIVQILSSRRIPFFFYSWTLSSDVLNMGLLLPPPLLPLLLFEEARFHSQLFPDASLKIQLRFNVVRILWAILVMFHGMLWRFATQIIKVLFIFRNNAPCFIDLLCAVCVQLLDGVQVGNFSHPPRPLIISRNHRAASEEFSTLEIALANNGRDVLVLLEVADVHQCNKVDFPYLLCMCAFFMTSFHSFSIVAFASGINIAWVERSFVCASWFPEACLSEREISRIFWTIRNSRFPMFADHNDIRSSYFFLTKFPLESILYSPDFLRFTWRILSHKYAVPRDETTCAYFHLQRKEGEELSWDLFIGTNSCVKLQNLRSF